MTETKKPDTSCPKCASDQYEVVAKLFNSQILLRCNQCTEEWVHDPDFVGNEPLGTIVEGPH